MKTKTPLTALLVFLFNIIVVQLFTQDPEKYLSPVSLIRISDAVNCRNYHDSLSAVFSDELLTGYIYSNLHETLPNTVFSYSFENDSLIELETDKNGRFFIPLISGSKNIRFKVILPKYHPFDTLFTIPPDEKSGFPVFITAKNRILLRGRVYVSNMPEPETNIIITHGKEVFTTQTSGCYTDAENYWNCLYLGMFRQEIIFDDPTDTITIKFEKDGYQSMESQLQIKDYSGSVDTYKLKYARNLKKFPHNNIALGLGHTFSNTWNVELSYLYMLTLGDFDRLGIGIDANFILDKLQSEYSAIENMPDASTETFYPTFLLGPMINLSLTAPSKRYFNTYTGVATYYNFNQHNLSLQPYLASKFYVDINKALFVKINYLLNYTLSVKQYEFNNFGSAYESESKESFKRLLLNIGLLVSF